MDEIDPVSGAEVKAHFCYAIADRLDISEIPSSLHSAESSVMGKWSEVGKCYSRGRMSRK